MTYPSWGMATESLPEPPLPGRRRPEVEPRRGMRLGRYELLAPLASGGMAQVWIARLAGEHGFERLVAIKTMRPEHSQNEAFRRMFLDEARLAARIAHANVVEVLDLGEDQGVVYQAMPLVEGDSIAGLLVRRKQLGSRGLPPGVAARLIADALCGLHRAHQLVDEDGRSLNLVHRDVSPQNVLVGVDGVAKIADFGVAKARLRLADETEAGQVKGKFAYMAPEQLERRTVDRRADVFSVGVVLWESLTGKRLFGGIDLLDTIAKVREAPIPDPRTRQPAIPEALAEATMRALSRDPSLRFETAAAMSAAVEDAARDGGVMTTARELGVLVADLCREELERRRDAVRDAARVVTRAGLPPPGLVLPGDPSALPAAPAAAAEGAEGEPALPAETTLANATLASTTIARSLVEASRSTAGPAGSRRTVVGAVAAALVVIAMGLGLAMLRGRANGTRDAVMAASTDPAFAPSSSAASSGARPMTLAPDPVPDPDPAAASAIPSADSAAAPPSSTVPSHGAPPSAPRATPRPRRPSQPAQPAPRVKYGNPYGP
jgi:hypothetical protein